MQAEQQGLLFAGQLPATFLRAGVGTFYCYSTVDAKWQKTVSIFRESGTMKANRGESFTALGFVTIKFESLGQGGSVACYETLRR